MKNLLLVATFLMASFASKAQNLVPTSSSVKYKKTSRPCVQASLKANKKDVEKAWKSYVKDKYDVKYKTKKGVMYAEKVVVSRITAKTIDFFTKISNSGDITEIKVFGALGYDIFIEEKDMSDEFKSMKVMLGEFLKDFLPKYHADMVSDAQKEVAKFAKEQENLSSSIDKDKKKIEDLKKDIIDLQGKLKTNESNIQKSKDLLEKRNAEMKTIQDALNKI